MASKERNVLAKWIKFNLDEISVLTLEAYLWVSPVKITDLEEHVLMIMLGKEDMQ